MSRPGLYANIHAKRKRGGKMRKKGAKGAPKPSDFKRAKKTARKKYRLNYVLEVKPQRSENLKFTPVHMLMHTLVKSVQEKLKIHLV